MILSFIKKKDFHAKVQTFFHSPKLFGYKTKLTQFAVQFKLICRANQLNLLHQLNALDAQKQGPTDLFFPESTALGTRKILVAGICEQFVNKNIWRYRFFFLILQHEND